MFRGEKSGKSLELVSVVLANPRFDVFANLDCHGSTVIGFALGDLSEIVIPADVALLAQFVERGNELFVWIEFARQNFFTGATSGALGRFTATRNASK